MAEFEKNSLYLKRIAEGDEEALALLVEENMGLVRSIALRFKDRGTDYEDLLQIGVIGMIKAAKSYDFSYETAFSTYAVPLIMGELRRHKNKQVRWRGKQVEAHGFFLTFVFRNKQF